MSVKYDGMVQVVVLKFLSKKIGTTSNTLTMRISSNVPSPCGRNAGRQWEDTVKYSQSCPREWPVETHEVQRQNERKTDALGSTVFITPHSVLQAH